ncbi:MAG: tannase/feruloyl esterase family alpha/beta hydrolase [Bryobacteraceae bacterium]|nr:tannase/feruloyl esterase family alpha/beta hydrolase [Bryobacteraceae bacterium]
MKAALLLSLLAPLGRAAGTPCEQLVDMTLPNVTIRSAVMAQTSPAGAALPAFCRIRAVARPVADSEIEFEVWIPAAWNGKFQGVGNGGYSGALGYAAMQRALRSGYATASHNTGHAGDDLRFGQGHPEKVRDYAYRAVHVMTVNAKLLIRAHTGRAADKHYFVGCSAGGHQAMSEAQRYPEDYDGIVAGAPANNRLRQTMGLHYSWRALHREDGTPIVPAAKLPLITQAVVASCDARDGLKDGLIADPRRCGPVDLSGILTEPEAEAVRKVWAGLPGIFAGWPMGSEDNGSQSWKTYLLTPTEPMRSGLFRYFLFHDPHWDWRTLDYQRDLAYAEQHLGFMQATARDMTPFARRGGKLLMYAGWVDPVVPPQDTVSYYEAVSRQMGEPATHGFFRLFMAPGMAHCGGGPGPNDFDSVGALDQWVTKGIAPERIIAGHATNGIVDRTRPLCAHPKVARYKGAGSIDEAANFVCAYSENSKSSSGER